MTALFLLAQLELDPGRLTAAVSALLGLAGVVLLWRGRQAIQGTTLVGPWLWTMVAWIALCGTEAAIGMLHWYEISLPDDQLRYLATMTLFCPQLSQVGSKRPNSLLWQLVVASFWLVLCVPVFQVWSAGSSGHVNPGWIWGTFLAVLILAGLLNNGPTRFAVSAICLAGAQVLMTYHYLPWTTAEVTVKGALLAIGLGLVGIGLVSLGWPGRSENLRPEDRAWLDFRDSFGGFWAAKVLFRVNDSAVRFEWGLCLSWTGFFQVEIVGSHPEFRDGVREGLVTCMRKLLSDFVDEAWLDERLPRPSKQKTGLEDLEV